jgi:hypothetical protein
LTQLHQFEIKVASSKGFVAEDYFDVTKNSWDLSKISEGIKKGQRLCLLGSSDYSCKHQKQRSLQQIIQ